MEERKTPLERFGGMRRVIFLVVGFIAASAIYHWQTASSSEALDRVGADLGLQFSRNGQRQQLDGRIGDTGVRVKITPDNIAGETRWFTDFTLHAPGQPPGKIVGASLRQKVIGGLEGADRISTGDTTFDRAVFVEGDPATILSSLDADARPAVQAATDVGWALEDGTWTARESGRLTSAEKIRFLLDTGLAAARALRTEDTPGAVESAGTTLPTADHGSAEPVTAANAAAALAEMNTPRSLEAALLLAGAGDDRPEVRTRLIDAVFSKERPREVIEALGKVGGPVEIAILSSVKGEHEEAARAAISSIEERR